MVLVLVCDVCSAQQAAANVERPRLQTATESQIDRSWAEVYELAQQLGWQISGADEVRCPTHREQTQ